jgi:hypothetical protein
MGVGQTTITNWELAHAKPTKVEVRQRLEDVLGTPFHILIERESGDAPRDIAAGGLEVSTQKDRCGTA